MIYLDYAANAPVEAPVLDAFLTAEQTFVGNPNSNHPAGQAALAAMERATESIAALLGAEPNEIIYTSGATEANNLAIKGIAYAKRHTGHHIISTPLEHASVGGSLTYLQEQGWEIDFLDITRDGTADLQQLRELLRQDTVLAAICAVDSELGTIQPLDKIKAILKDYPNCHLHIDATQAFGRIPVSFAGVDTLSLAPHKFGGLNGSGLLLKRKNLVLEPQLHGGGSTTIYRSGTPAAALAVSIETALRLALQHRAERFEQAVLYNQMLRESLIRYTGVRINSPENSVPQILNLSVQNVRGTVFQRMLAERGVCVSVKSDCSAQGTPSGAVFAVSKDRKNALSSWRVSISHRTTEDQLSAFLQIFDDCYRKLTGKEGAI